jgi:hypothetical protein
MVRKIPGILSLGFSLKVIGSTMVKYGLMLLIVSSSLSAMEARDNTGDQPQKIEEADTQDLSTLSPEDLSTLRVKNSKIIRELQDQYRTNQGIIDPEACEKLNVLYRKNGEIEMAILFSGKITLKPHGVTNNQPQKTRLKRACRAREDDNKPVDKTLDSNQNNAANAPTFADIFKAAIVPKQKKIKMLDQDKTGLAKRRAALEAEQDELLSLQTKDPLKVAEIGKRLGEIEDELSALEAIKK